MKFGKSPEFNIPDRNSERFREEDRLEVDDLLMLKKDYPPLRDWPKFYGEGEYNHVEFIEWIDDVKKQFHMHDRVIIPKLTTLFQGLAKEWYKAKRKVASDNDLESWDFWKQEINKKFGSQKWKQTMARAFEKDYFTSGTVKEPLKWLLQQKKRMDAAWPGLDQEEIMSRIVYQCSGDIRHAVKSRLPIEAEFDEFMEQFTETISDISRNRTSTVNIKTYSRIEQNKDDYRNNQIKQVDMKRPIKPEDKGKGKEITCNICGKAGHKAPDCRSKKGINNVDVEQNEENPHESDNNSAGESDN